MGLLTCTVVIASCSGNFRRQGTPTEYKEGFQGGMRGTRATYQWVSYQGFDSPFNGGGLVRKKMAFRGRNGDETRWWDVIGLKYYI